MYALFTHLWDEALRLAQADGSLDELVEAVARREMDPYTAARRLAEGHSSGR